LTNFLIFLAALVFAVCGTPLARRLAHRAGMTDEPSARKEHLEPTPLLGGAAIYGAVILALLLFGERAEVAQVAGIILGATMVSFLGLWDDKRPIRPVIKVLAQAGAAGLLVATGVSVTATGVLWLDVLLTVAFVLAITNALNFLDNMDGLSAGVAAVSAAGFLILAVANGQQLVAPLAAAVLGASLGFLVYNFNPASVFMGDTGSLFLGFVLAALAIKLRFPGRPVAATWVVPVFVLLVPLFDLALVLISRTRRRVNPFTTGGTDHVSHRLVARGFTRREAVMAHYLVGCAAAGLGILLSYGGVAEAFLALGAVFGVGAWAIARFEGMELRRRTPVIPSPGAHTPAGSGKS
jgi:UDP-GlcNAc:undecaprenyl-phosphate GlcNAc-1-phosphate transferase